MTQSTVMILNLECEVSDELDVHVSECEMDTINVESENKIINSEDSVVCKICKQQNNNVRTFIVHYQIEHMGVKPYVCGKCNVGFDTVLDLKEHHWIHRKRKRREDGKTKHQCCSKNGKRCKSILTDGEDDLYTCDICSECCLNIQNYDVHMRNHVNKNSHLLCNACDCSFSDEQNQIRHNALYHDSKRKFSCSNCSQWFDVLSCYANHRKHCKSTHTCICKICSREYISLGGRKYCCNLCAKDTFYIKDIRFG